VLLSATYVSVDPSRSAREILTLASQTGEIKALAGVDFLTISPALLEELNNDTVPVPKKLDATAGKSLSPLGA
jgi:hypothetical protein